jgi:hypothetical protein
MAVLADEPTPGLDEFKAKLQKVTDLYSKHKDDLYGARKVMKEIQQREMVNHPDHYQGSGGMEVIDIIENYNLGFSLGNAIKYILRSNKKGSAKQDLKKAIWYINREISNLVEEEDSEDV